MEGKKLVMEDNTCKFNGCDRPNKTIGYCNTHASQHYRGERLRPIGSKTTAASVRHHLEALINKHGVAETAKLIGRDARTVHRLRNTDCTITEKTADRIALAALNSAPSVAKDSCAEVVEYSLTAEGRAFIAQCRAPKKPRAAA